MKRKKMVVNSVVAIGLLTFTVAANAETNEGDRLNAFKVKLGVLAPLSDMDDAGYDVGSNISLSYERHLSDLLVLETTLEFSGNEDSSDGSNSVAGSYSLDNYLISNAILVTLKAEHNLGSMDVYGGGGVGMYHTTLYGEVDSSALGEFDVDDSETILGAHLVAGFNYNFTEKWFMGVEGMYRWTDDVDLAVDTASIPLSYDGDLSGYSFTINGGFRF